MHAAARGPGRQRHTAEGNARRWPLRRIATAAVAAALLAAPAVSATIAEQRARLPPPAECADPVEGLWRAHRHRRDTARWRVFTLTIRRVGGSATALVGTIRNEGWNGGPDRVEPGACAGLREHWVVTMPARGAIHGDDLVFSGEPPWRLDRVLCGLGPSGYNLDSFSGRIDHGLQEFQSVNNDGGADVNVPTVFRRVGCFERGAAPHVDVAPPPFFPDRDARGCL